MPGKVVECSTGKQVHWGQVIVSWLGMKGTSFQGSVAHKQGWGLVDITTWAQEHLVKASSINTVCLQIIEFRFYLVISYHSIQMFLKLRLYKLPWKDATMDKTLTIFRGGIAYYSLRFELPTTIYQQSADFHEQLFVLELQENLAVLTTSWSNSDCLVNTNLSGYQ